MEVYEYPGYRCGPCPPGLQGNGTHCTDINEVGDGGPGGQRDLAQGGGVDVHQKQKSLGFRTLGCWKRNEEGGHKALGEDQRITWGARDQLNLAGRELRGPRAGIRVQ